MTFSLQDLSQELLIQIGQSLIDIDSVDNSAIESKNGLLPKPIQYDEDGNYLKVDPALKTMGIRGLRNLSRTCSAFYKILSTLTFECVVLHNTDRSGTAVKYLSTTPQVANVRTLHFKGDGPGELDDNWNDVEGILPTDVRSILANLSIFPNLAKVIVDLDIHLDQNIDQLAHWDDFVSRLMEEYGEPDETPAEVLEAEEEWAWRALQADTFAELSKNEVGGSIQELEVKLYPTKRASTFGSDNLNRWLGGLKTFNFVIYAGELGACWHHATLTGFIHFIDGLDKYFFDALKNVERLSIRGTDGGSVGDSEERRAPLPLKPCHMPQLRELDLQYYFIDAILVDFLVAHSETLRQINFIECCSNSSLISWPNSSHSGSKSITWGSLFQQYAAHKPPALQSITFSPHHGSICEGYEYKPDEIDEKECKAIDHVLEILFESFTAKYPKVVFQYAMKSDKYGDVFLAGDTNREAFQKGEDQKGWEQIVDVMRENRVRTSANV